MIDAYFFTVLPLLLLLLSFVSPSPLPLPLLDEDDKSWVKKLLPPTAPLAAGEGGIISASSHISTYRSASERGMMMEGGGWLSSCVCIWSSWAVILMIV